jgi:hypothetical protein
MYGAAVSYPYVGVNVVNQTASISARTTPFTLNSGIFKFRTDGVSLISAIGYVGGTPTFSTLIGFPGVREFNWENLSQVSFLILTTGAQFTVDDLTITEQTSTVSRACFGSAVRDGFAWSGSYDATETQEVIRSRNSETGTPHETGAKRAISSFRVGHSRSVLYTREQFEGPAEILDRTWIDD